MAKKRVIVVVVVGGGAGSGGSRGGGPGFKSSMSRDLFRMTIIFFLNV